MRAGQLGRRTGGCQWVARPEWVGRWAGVGLGWGGAELDLISASYPKAFSPPGEPSECSLSYCGIPQQ